MSQISKFVGITIPKTLFDKIEFLRKDMPRSYVYKKLLEYSYQQNFLQELKIDGIIHVDKKREQPPTKLHTLDFPKMPGDQLE